MTIDPGQWAHVAHVARLRLGPEELARLANEAEAVLAHFEAVQRFPKGKGADGASGLTLREDQPSSFEEAQAIRENFPRERNGVAVVPRNL